jgi:hypothetical protein
MMEQRKKNKWLLISLGILLAASVGVATWGNSGSKLEIKVDFFSRADLTAVDRVEMEGPGGKVVLRYDNGRWLVNDTQQAEPQLVDVFFAVVNQVKVKRPVAQAQAEGIRDEFKSRGVEVILWEGDKVFHRFVSVGNSTRTHTYFAENIDSKAYLVGIPGYQSYVGGILELTESEWWNRLAFPVNWRNLQSLHVRFPADTTRNYSIAYGNVFFEVKEIPQTDTTRLADFIDEVSMLRVDNYLTSHHPDRDSLLQVTPEQIIEVVQIGGRSRSLELLPMAAGTRERLVRIGPMLGVMDNRQLQGILLHKEKFAPTGD